MDKSKLRKDKNESQEGKLFYLEHCWSRNWYIVVAHVLDALACLPHVGWR